MIPVRTNKSTPLFDLFCASQSPILSVKMNRKTAQERPMSWTKLLASITGGVDQELLLRNAYLVTENRILCNQIRGRAPGTAR